MYLHTTFREALRAPRQPWLGIIRRVLAKWVNAARAQRGSRWYDGDGAHRGM
jgi:hypothetical protein